MVLEDARGAVIGMVDGGGRGMIFDTRGDWEEVAVRAQAPAGELARAVFRGPLCEDDTDPHPIYTQITEF